LAPQLSRRRRPDSADDPQYHPRGGDGSEHGG
jgi:hypothetical protein